MRILSCIVLIFLSLPCWSRTFYFSSVSGNDSRTSVQAMNPSTPWNSITKINALFAGSIINSATNTAIILTTKDTISLKTGELFFGNIVVGKSGTSAGNIVINTYPSGSPKAIVSGLQALPSSGWAVTTKANVYTNSTAMTVSSVRIMVKNGALAPISRFPNRGAANTDDGYRKVTSASGRTFGDNTFNSQVNTDGFNWYNGEAGSKTIVVVRGTDFDNDKGYLTANPTNSFTYTARTVDGGSTPKTNWGYFLTNNKHACDQEAEWAYTSDGKITMYSASALSGQVVEYPKYKIGIEIGGFNYITVDNIAVQGYDSVGINIGTGTNSVVKNCDIKFTGLQAISFTNHDFGTASRNTISSSANRAIGFKGGSNFQIDHNTVLNTGMDIGMSNSGGASSDGILASAESGVIEYNKIINTGRGGIVFSQGSNITVRYNYAENNCNTMVDYGGVYTVASASNGDSIPRRNLIIRGNIVKDLATGGYHGTDDTKIGNLVSGIYADNYSNHITIDSNTVINCPVGIYLHHVYQITAAYNNIYDCAKAFRLNNDRQNFVYGLNIHHNNILLPSTSGGPIYLEEMATTSRDLNNMGSIDFNKYFQPLDQAGMQFQKYVGPGTGTSSSTTTYSFSNWKSSFSPWDANGSASPPVTSYVSPNNTSTTGFKVVFNNNETPSSFNLGGKAWRDMNGTAYSNDVITLAPFKSAMLMYTGAATVVNNPSVISISSPSPNATFTTIQTISISATATDIEGLSKIEFFDGNTLLYTSVSSPATYSWAGAAVGPHTINVRATDALGSVTTSSVNIVVSSPPQSPPTIDLVSPISGGSYVAGNTISLSANAYDDGSISSVTFYNGTTLIATSSSTTNPYTASFVPSAGGTYTITAKAQDNNGNISTSTVSTISVSGNTAPTAVSVTNPQNSGVYNPGTTIYLTTAASDDNAVVSVSYYNNGVLLGSVNTGGLWIYTLPSVSAGNYSITAKAFDAQGLNTTSVPIVFAVPASYSGPVVSLISPVVNQNFNAPASITITIQASIP